MGEYNICFSLDDSYSEHLAVTLASILTNSAADEAFNFFVLDGGITNPSKERINELKKIKDFKLEYVKINREDFKKCPLLNQIDENYKDYHVTLPTYFRFKLASLFPSLDKILYLDCDLVVLGSLKELMELELGKNYIAMVPDVENENESERLNIKQYCNAGVMLVNLKEWRKEKIEQKLFSAIDEYKDVILWQDQDILNLVFEDNMVVLPRKWNFQYFLYNPSRQGELFEQSYKYNILHYAGRFKPWFDNFEHPLFQAYYKYLEMTPWRGKLLEKMQAKIDREFNFKKNQIKEDFAKFYQERVVDTYKLFGDQNEIIDKKFEAIKSEIKDNASFETQELKKFLTDEIWKNKEFVESLASNASLSLQEKTDLLYQDLDKNYKYTEKILGEKSDELYAEISKLYRYLEEFVVSKHSELIQQSLASEVELLNNKFDQKTREVFDVRLSELRDELIKNTEKQVSYKSNELYSEMDKINKYLERKCIEAVQSSELKLHEQKEFFNRLITTKTENLRNFFEEAIKTQLDLLNNSYENVSVQQKELYKKELENTVSYHKELLETKLEAQKQWYQNELQSQKNWYEVESQKKANDGEIWHRENLNKILSEKELWYEAELNRRINEIEDFYKREIDILVSKNNLEKEESLSSQKNWYEEEINRRLKETSDWYENEIKNKTQSTSDWYEGEIIRRLEEQKSYYENEINNLNHSNQQLNEEVCTLRQEIETQEEKNSALVAEVDKERREKEKDLMSLETYYESKIKPVKKIIGLIESKNRLVNKIKNK